MKNEENISSCFDKDQKRRKQYKKKIILNIVGHFSALQDKDGRQSLIQVLYNEDKGSKRNYLLLKLGDFFTHHDLPIKRNLYNIISFSHSRSTTDLSAIFILINSSDKTAEEFINEIQQNQLTQDKAARLVDIICDETSSQGILVVGNKRLNLRMHESMLHSISEVSQIGEQQSFFLPDSFTGASQQCERVSAILENKLLELVPVEFNTLEPQKISEKSPIKPKKSSSQISLLSIRKRSKQESLIIDDKTFTDSLIKVTKYAPLGAELAQQLIKEAAGQIYQPEKTSQRDQDLIKIKEDVHGDLAQVSDDQDSPYVREVKRLLTRECNSSDEGGKLVAIQGLRDSEEIVNSMLSVLYEKKSSDIITSLGLQRLPKVIIIASQNKRLEQIQDTIEQLIIKEATDPLFKFKKTQVSKAQKQKFLRKDPNQNESFRTIFDVNQVLILLDRKFFNHLIYGDIDMSEVDYLIFDEVHSIYPESTYVDIMNKFVYNHKLMLSLHGTLEENKTLPKVIAFFSLESILQATQNNDQQIMKKFYFMANTFNSSLLCLHKQDFVQLERDIVREFSQSRVRNIQDISHLNHQLQYSREFFEKVRKYLTFNREGKNRVVCQPQRITEKKKLKPYQYLDTKFAKITLDEAIYTLQDLGAQQLEYLMHSQNDKQNILYKPILESAQQVFSKVRYFSSRIQFDELLHQLLGKDNINNFETKLVIASQNDQNQKKTSWLYSTRIYLKKTQSESHAALEMCKILYQLGFLDQFLKASIVRPSVSLQLEAPSANQSDQISTINSSSKKTQYEEEKTSASDTNASTEFDNADTQSSQTIKDQPPSSFSSKYSKTHNEKQLENLKMLRRVYKISPDSLVEEEANELFYNQYKKNNEDLNEGIKNGQHHMPIMHYNIRQLKLFIKTILNPILKALNVYNDLCDAQETLIRFDDLNANMISESSIKELLFQHLQVKIKGEEPASLKVNETFIQFKRYRQRMFSIFDKHNKQKNQQEFPSLVQMIDESLERYKFPHFMTKHVKNYHRKDRGTRKSAPKAQEEFNRKTFLSMLMIALSDKEPTTMEFDKVKNEMGRLAFVGDSIIILCQVFTMIFSGQKSFSEKELDAIKNKTVKNENLKQRAQKVGLDYFKIYAKYYQKTAPNPLIEGGQKSRHLGDIIKSLAGLFSIYLGFGATYLFLSDFGIVEPPTTDLMIKIGEISVAQKVKILETISKNRKDLLNYERDNKRQIFDILCNEQYLGLNKEPLSGTEIIEVWQKIVKSRGLFMKDDLKEIFPIDQTAELNEDDSQKQLRDYSISLSYLSSDSMQTFSESNTKQKRSIDSFIETLELQPEELEEEKSRMPQDEPCISQEIFQDFNQFPTYDTASDSTQMKTKCSKYSDGQTMIGDDDQSKTGGDLIDECIFDDTTEPNKRQINQFEIFERNYKKSVQKGYEFKNIEILMQSIVHKSYSEKLQNSGALFKDSSQIEKDLKMQFNLQILEYLGDSILNFTISKLFYCETVESYKQWHGDFFVPTKLHELKTWFTSNSWLSFALYDNYYCTITEEIPSDSHFVDSKFAKKAQEALQQLKNKNISEKEAFEIAPRVPLIYDQNDNFQVQINDFNASCFKQCLAADKNEVEKIQNYPREVLKVTSKSLSMKLFKDKDVQQQDQNEVDFSEIDEKFVKYFSDVMEALIGSIFMDSGNLDQTQMILLKLINCPSVTSFPIVQHDRTAVLSVFNSKPYCKGIKLYHTLEEKDGQIYIMGYMGKLQFRRLKYSKDRKKKVHLFYFDMRLYLEDAYKEFEMKFVQRRTQDDKREPTNDDWLDFNKDYRKIWKVKVYSADQKRYSAIKEAAKNLYKFVSSAEENFRTRENQQIPDMRDQIIMFLNEGLHTISANHKHPLLVLESERVQSSRIRELLQSSDIKFIDCLSNNMKDVGNFIDKLNNRQVHQFYEHLIEFGKN